MFSIVLNKRMKNTGFSRSSLKSDKMKGSKIKDQQSLNQRVNKIIKDNKIAMPITRKGFKQLAKALNMHCTEMLSYEAILHCRG